MTDVWATPQDLFDRLNEEFHFDLDVCALPENAKCKRYYTPEQDGLKQPWDGVVWCNPPYSKGNIPKWLEKALKENATVVMLLPVSTDTGWFHDYIQGKAEVRFIRGKVKFGGAKWTARFPSMIVIFRRKNNETESKT